MLRSAVAWLVMSVAAYEDAQLLHNVHCVSWKTMPLAEAHQPIPAHPGVPDSGICTRGIDGAMHVCQLSEEDPSLRVAVANDSCRVWWHLQAFNALPLPLLTAWVVHTGLEEHADESCLTARAGLCATRGTGERRIGLVHADAKCVISGATETVIEGDFDILGAYDMDQPYAFTVANSKDLSSLLGQLDRLVAELLTDTDRDTIAAATGVVSWWPELRSLLTVKLGQSFVYRVLSEERYIHHGLANQLGLHLLRCLLAERAIDASRALRGHTSHPDYEAFSQTGLLYKDFRALDHVKLRALMAMVSGFAEETLPLSVSWELRSTSILEGDPNLDLHVDTFHPSQKMWLAVTDIREEHGPFNSISGSHRNDETKLRWCPAPPKQAIQSHPIPSHPISSYSTGSTTCQTRLLRLGQALMDPSGYRTTTHADGVWDLRGPRR